MSKSSARVLLHHGTDRVGNLASVLTPVVNDIDWSSKRDVLVKPNFVDPTHPLANSRREAIDAVVRAIRSRYDGRLAIAEGCAFEPTHGVFRSLGIDEIAATHHASLVDLNQDDAVTVRVFDERSRPMTLPIARTVVRSDCRVSLSLPKTHDAVVVTLTIKNMIMGGLLNRPLAGRAARFPIVRRLMRRLSPRNGKLAMHQGPRIMNVNLAILAPLAWPHLSVLDGFHAMEGAGPIEGQAVDWRIALAGVDALAVDAVAARLMGFRVRDVGYLHYCSRRGLGRAAAGDIEVASNVALASVQRSFARHPGHARQSLWRHPGADALIEAGLAGPGAAE